MADGTAPRRIARLIAGIDIPAAGDVLEIGCGHGLAIPLIAERLAGGRLIAIDRSAKMVAAASRRNAKLLEHATVEVKHAELGRLAGQFDLIMAMNVNAFWLDARRTADAAARLLKPHGQIAIMSHAPPQMSGRDTMPAISSALQDCGLVVTSATSQSCEDGHISNITARRLAPCASSF